MPYVLETLIYFPKCINGFCTELIPKAITEALFISLDFFFLFSDESSRNQTEENFESDNFLKIPTEDVRKSPRLRRESNRLKDFVQYINPLKLVKSIFSNPEE